MANESESHSVTTTSSIDARSAMVEVFKLARKNLRIFLSDLSDVVFKDPAVVKVFELIVLEKSSNTIEVVVHNANNIERDCARLMQIIRLHTDNFIIYETTQAAKSAGDSLVIADDHSVWHKLHHDHPKVVTIKHDHRLTTPLLGRFMEIQEASERVAVATVLGL